MDNNLAFTWVYYTNIFSPKAGGNPIKDEGKLIFVFEKRSGSSWKISRVIWNNDIPSSE